MLWAIREESHGSTKSSIYLNCLYQNNRSSTIQRKSSVQRVKSRSENTKLKMTLYSHTITCEGWGAIWEISNSEWVTDHKLLRYSIFSLFFDVWWFTILESKDKEVNSLMNVIFPHQWFHWDILDKKKSPGKINPETRLIVLITSNQLAIAGKDNESAHFLCMS